MKDARTINTLMDSANAVYHELKKGRYENVSFQMDLLSNLCNEYKGLRIEEFRILNRIAKGAYGEVFVAEREGKTYAIKRIMKDTVVQQPFTALFMSEKELMVDARGSMWLLSAHYTLQDEEAVYFVMDFLPGGDFMGYLVKKEKVSENEIRFYGAEVILALEELHSLGYIHRDLKPENILIERSGHIKLADFGSCIKAANGKVRSSSTVGTPDYVSPDVLCGAGTEAEYGHEVDLWTLGVVLYEMLYEVPPFYSETLQETYEKITNIEFSFSEGGSSEFRDLIEHLLCDRERRLNISGVKAHAFFHGIVWERIREEKPPFIPELKEDLDLSHFERSEDSGSTFTKKETKKSEEKHFLSFVGFTFDPDCTLVPTKESGVKLGKADIFFTGRLPRMSTAHIDVRKSLFSGLGVQTASIEVNVVGKSIKKSLAGLRVAEIACRVQDAASSLEDVATENRNLHLDLGEARSQNVSLINSLNLMSFENSALREKDMKTQFYKKELRIKRTEVKEFEQKLENEILAKKRVEEEVFFLKKEIERLSKNLNRRGVFRVRILSEGGVVSGELEIENQNFRLLGEEWNINNVFIRTLKNNELFHMSYKDRNVSVCIIMIQEVSRCGVLPRTSLKALREAIKKEENIQSGIERIMQISSGSVIGEAKMQLEGSKKRLIYLRNELGRLEMSSDFVDEEYSDKEHYYEYNNHRFAIKTFEPQTLCEYCNDVLRGVRDQGLECIDCVMIVHRNCYVLTDISCEMYAAIKQGKKLYVMMRNMEEKERLLRWVKH